MCLHTYLHTFTYFAHPVFSKGNRHDLVADLITGSPDMHGKCGIVYVGTVKEVEKTWAALRDKGVRACKYYAGLGDQEKVTAHEQWSEGRNAHVIVATVAFGMGINKLDVRLLSLYYYIQC